MNKLQVKSLFGLVGSFWTKIATSANLTKQLFKAQLHVHEQVERAATELVESAGNAEVPAGKVTTWSKFVFGLHNQSKVLYGDPNSKYGTSYFYGQLQSNVAIYDIDEDILSIPFLYDDPVNPTKVLTEGIDYKIANGKMSFKNLLSFDGTPVTLYARNMVRESGFTTSRLGYAIGVYLGDKVYRAVPFSHLWKFSTYGPTYFGFLNMLGAAAGAPIVQSDETVEYVGYYNNIQVIVTDKAAYATSAAKSLSFAIGTQLKQGTSLSTGLQILHDKEPIINSKVPEIFRNNKVFKYGKDLAYGYALIIVKADIAGVATLALKTFKDLLPLDVKVLIYTNQNVPAATVSGANFNPPSESFNFASKCVRVNDLSIALTNSANDAISIKTAAKVKYSFYGQ